MRWNPASQARVRRGETTSQRQQMGPAAGLACRGRQQALLELPVLPCRTLDPLQPPKYRTSEATAGWALHVAVYSSSLEDSDQPRTQPQDSGSELPVSHNPPYLCS